MSIVELQMLKMYDHTKLEEIRHDDIHKKVQIADMWTCQMGAR